MTTFTSSTWNEGDVVVYRPLEEGWPHDGERCRVVEVVEIPWAQSRLDRYVYTIEFEDGDQHLEEPESVLEPLPGLEAMKEAVCGQDVC